MELRRLKIRRKVFSKLPQAAQLFLIRFGQAHNDLRFIRQLIVVAQNGLNTLSGTEREIATHQWVFAVKLWCGTLTEAENIISAGWRGSGRLSLVKFSAERK